MAPGVSPFTPGVFGGPTFRGKFSPKAGGRISQFGDRLFSPWAPRVCLRVCPKPLGGEVSPFPGQNSGSRLFRKPRPVENPRWTKRELEGIREELRKQNSPWIGPGLINRRKFPLKEASKAQTGTGPQAPKGRPLRNQSPGLTPQAPDRIWGTRSCCKNSSTSRTWAMKFTFSSVTLPDYRRSHGQVTTRPPLTPEDVPKKR